MPLVIRWMQIRCVLTAATFPSVKSNRGAPTRQCAFKPLGRDLVGRAGVAVHVGAPLGCRLAALPRS